MNRNIYLTDASRRSFGPPQIDQFIRFLARERDRVLVPGSVVSDSILKGRPLVRTPLSDIFQRAVDHGKADLLSFVHIPKLVRDVPEPVTYTHMTFDVLQFRDVVRSDLYRALATTPFKDKMVLNITAWLNASLAVSNLQAIHTITVRDLFSRSYYLSRAPWITARFVKDGARFYGRVLGSVIGRVHNLTFAERQSVATLFACYYILKCTDVKSFATFLKANEREMGFVRSDVEQVAARMEDSLKRKDSFTMQEACLLAREVSPTKMRNFSFKVLSTKTKGWDPSIFVSQMALEFPPYFVFLLASSASGRKSSLTFDLKKLGLDRDVKTFVTSLASSDAVFKSMQGV